VGLARVTQRPDDIALIRSRHRDGKDAPVSIPLAALFLGAFWLILGDAAFPVFGGFLLGYLFYDYTHYYVHHFVPRTKFGKRLREHHMRHHFQDHRYGYGVSSPIWDVAFRTLPRKRNPR